MDIVAESLTRLREGIDPDDIYGAMQRLANCGERALPRLIQVLLDPTERHSVRVNVAAIVAIADVPSVYEPLVTLLHETAPELRSGGASALGALRDPRAIPLLQRLADSDRGVVTVGNFSYTVAASARQAIAEIQKKPGVPKGWL